MRHACISVPQALVAMACASGGFVGVGRASASAIAAFLLVFDFVLILAIRPHRSLLTNIESAWVSFCLGNGFWSLTKHFHDRSGDDTPVSAVWHLIAVASSFVMRYLLPSSVIPVPFSASCFGPI